MPASFDTGKLVISLDFELFWGVRDKRTIDGYGPNIIGVQKVIPALLDAFDRYSVKGTFSTVGFLFARNKEELLSFIPDRKPLYTDPRLSPYPEIATIGNDESADPYHFGFSLLRMIKENGRHEIGTHTFCHYYCLEPGQGPEDFRADLDAAQKIAGAMGSVCVAWFFREISLTVSTFLYVRQAAWIPTAAIRRPGFMPAGIKMRNLFFAGLYGSQMLISISADSTAIHRIIYLTAPW